MTRQPCRPSDAHKPGLRRQDDWVASYWRHSVRTGQTTLSLEEFRNRPGTRFFIDCSVIGKEDGWDRGIRTPIAGTKNPSPNRWTISQSKTATAASVCDKRSAVTVYQPWGARQDNRAANSKPAKTPRKPAENHLVPQCRNRASTSRQKEPSTARRAASPRPTAPCGL